MTPTIPVVAPEHEFTVAGLIRRFARTLPDREMLVAGEVRRSWLAEYQQACQVGRACRRDGIGVGDRVAFLDRNGLPYFDLLFGGALIGAVNVAVNWRLAPNEMAAIIDDSAAPILVVHTDYLAALADMGSTLPAVRRIVVVSDDGAVGPWSDGRAVSFDQWIDGCATTDPGHVGRARTSACSSTRRGRRASPKG